MLNTTGIHNRIIVALDYPDAKSALKLVENLNPKSCRVKIGKELFARSGPELIRLLTNKGFDVFLDLKFHDIPNTVARACEVAADMGVWMINVHAMGGRRMLEAARKSVDNSKHRPLLIAVTILTSMDEQDIQEIGLEGSVSENVLRLAALASQTGLDGVVCSPNEAAVLKSTFGPNFHLVTPGIRPGGEEYHDQKRVMTPSEAIRNGSDFLVIGRAITNAEKPASALNNIQTEIDKVLTSA